MDRARGSERKGGRLWASFPREVAGASRSRWRGDPAAGRASPGGLCKTSGTWPAAGFHLVPTQLFVCFFFFEMYCQYFKAGRFKKKNKNGFLGFL